MHVRQFICAVVPKHEVHLQSSSVYELFFIIKSYKGTIYCSDKNYKHSVHKEIHKSLNKYSQKRD